MNLIMKIKTKLKIIEIKLLKKIKVEVNQKKILKIIIK